MGNDYINFDFDQWKELAKSDPEAFEVRRRARIKQLIEKHPDNLRILESFQQDLDKERWRHRCPMGSCLKLYGMMMDKFYLELQPKLSKIPEAQKRFDSAECEKQRENVVPFRKNPRKLNLIR